jgi:hypothetical protein
MEFCQVGRHRPVVEAPNDRPLQVADAIREVERVCNGHSGDEGSCRAFLPEVPQEVKRDSTEALDEDVGAKGETLRGVRSRTGSTAVQCR